jgi:hypothetical protein
MRGLMTSMMIRDARCITPTRRGARIVWWPAISRPDRLVMAPGSVTMPSAGTGRRTRPGLHVGEVGLGEAVDRHAAGDVMHVHEQRHWCFPRVTGCVAPAVSGSRPVVSREKCPAWRAGLPGLGGAAPRLGCRCPSGRHRGLRRCAMRHQSWTTLRRRGGARSVWR